MAVVRACQDWRSREKPASTRIDLAVAISAAGDEEHHVPLLRGPRQNRHPQCW